jgi:glutathione S-transferase
MSDPHLTVYRLQACPFCERVVRKLNDLGLEYDSRFVEARHSRRNVVKRVSGKRTVPALVDERTGVTMSESGNIVEYLDATYGPGGAAADEGTAARADGGR